MALDINTMFGGVLLLLAGIGMFVACRYSPALRGLAWIASSLVAGGVGSGLLVAGDRATPSISAVFADLFLLLLFVFIQIAILEVLHRPSIFPMFGTSILFLQAAADVYCIDGCGGNRLRIAVSSFLIAVQACATVRLFLLAASDERRMPARFSATILLGLGLFNLLRGIAVAAVLPHSMLYRADLFACPMYFIAALGTAFGFFWMSTTIVASDLENMASIDPLTKIYNRRAFLQFCDRELSRSQRRSAPFSVLMMDLDHFKQINDTFGHRVGDEVLCRVAERMQQSLRGIDVIGRWGGEEFAGLLPGATSDAALSIAQRVRQDIEEILYLGGGGSEVRNIPCLRVTVSVGIATYRGDFEGLDDLLQRADAALYGAKASGRNCVLVNT